MLKKLATKLERERQNLELGEMQEVSRQLGLNDYEQADGYGLENQDTVNE